MMMMVSSHEASNSAISTCTDTLSFLLQLVVLVGLGLNAANLVGYIRCKKDAGKKLKSFAGNFLGRQLLNQVLHRKV